MESGEVLHQSFSQAWASLNREAVEEAERIKKEKEKKEKEEAKKLIKGERKKLRTIAKDNNYFTSDETEKVTNLAEVEKVCEIYTHDQTPSLFLGYMYGADKETNNIINTISVFIGLSR